MGFFRVRFRCSSGDFSRRAWEKGVIGIWYGAWGPERFAPALKSPDPAKYLSSLPQQKKLGWEITSGYFSAARRFYALTEQDWVFTYFDDAIHLARIASGVLLKADAELSMDGELFKVRRIKGKRSFSLSELPDCFRLLSSAGRGNIHEVHGTRKLVELLASSDSERKVCERFAGLKWEDWLEALGPFGWESLCLGYLILEENFVPTGLTIGRTLPTFDIIGRSRTSTQILAQCKKDILPVVLDTDFLSTCKQCHSDAKLFLFLYAGATNAPEEATVITGDDLKHWFESTENGRSYQRLLR